MSRNKTSNTMLDDKIMSEFNARSYQTEIMEQAKSENLIVCLPTGSGKTYIAIMLIKELSSAVRPSLNDGGKRTVILVKTVELARQHCDTMSKHLDLNIKVHCGPSKIKLHDRNGWNNEFENNQVLIFTVQTFLNLLDHNLFSLHQVNLLIFDECHHATGDGQYATIMKKYDSCSNCPRILGLTASISGQKIEPKNLQKAANQLQTIYHARVETGSNREEITVNSTSVNVIHERCTNYKHTTCQKDKTVMNIFKIIQCLFDDLDKYLKTKKQPDRHENDSSKIIDHSDFIQLQCRTLDQLKSQLDNIIHIGYDLGLYGLSLGIKSLRNYLKSKNTLSQIIDQSERGLYDKIINKLDSLIEDDFKNLTENPKILYSDKVIKLEEYIKKNNNGQCIVFVERVYTAAFLCQVLKEKFQNSIQIKYIAGSKAYIDRTSVSDKYQREVVKEFREKDIDVLISTAIIEEGLDVPGCNLVIRFNKPQNFSSYMQSKGRARARTGNAQFVLLRDEFDFEAFASNKQEYQNYEFMEKMLKQNFKTDYDIEQSSNDDFKPLKPYRLQNGVQINGIRAVQIIYQYCAVHSNGQLLSPRFCFSITDCNMFKCILSMPLNCPIREDIICENKNKKLAKQECCLKMVEMLHKKDELDQYCLPIPPERCLATDDSSDDDDEPVKVSTEVIDKQTSYFPHPLSTQWHLYRINISNNNDLGFVVPCELIKLPIFNLYGRDSQLTVEIVYLKAIDLKQYEKQLEAFCRYIFEQVFDDMNTRSESILKFNIESATFKLLPCLLTQSDDIDCLRMATICYRKNKLIQHPSELNDNELYRISYLSEKQLFMNISDEVPLKRAGDKWQHKKLLETIETYADHFEYKVPGIHIQRDMFMATMKDFRKLRINYLKDSPLKKDKELIIKTDYYPVEVLRYAPLNQTDLQLIYKLPSILVRISQLYYIEQLRYLLATNIQSYSLLEADQMPTVTFTDCLASILTSTQSTVLPLDSLKYDLLLKNNCQLQPSPDLLFQSITRHSADENADMENLEILGDCFLKLAMSMSLYHRYPSDGAGKLTPKKDKQVSNENLHRLAMKKQLQNYLNVNKSIYEGREANWIPPGYEINEDTPERYTKQKVKRKAFADMIEALIGAYLISTDYITTMKFMQWLGLDVIPTDSQKTPSVLCSGQPDTVNDVNLQEFFSNQAFDEIEKKINYVFKNKAYLIAAFTHASYVNNRLTQCYERLEYLGDAVLDFLVIRCVFVKHYKHVTPSKVTNIRQDLSNNGRLAYILVSCDLHKNILHYSRDLFDQITSYLGNETLLSKDLSIEDKLSKDIDQWADSTAPKALADVFEALVGAIFLDSGYSLETVWKIIEPLLRQYINRSIEHPNLNPIRSVFEHDGKIIEILQDDEGNFTCIVKLPNGTEVKGHGRNKRLAKFDACRKAINFF